MTDRRKSPPPDAVTSPLEEGERSRPASAGGRWERELSEGTIVGRFRIGREIGRGGFGTVYEARDRDLGRLVAFKLMRAGRKPAAREQWMLREAEAAARLSHPNIVTLHDVGWCENGPYMVLELLQGRTLAERLEEGPLSPAEALRVATEVTRGLAHAHAKGVLHRDLHPHNVFLCEDGQVKVLDFGLAGAAGGPRVSGGTPAYMAPERWEASKEDERADVFSLGVMFFLMFAGGLPWKDARGASGEARRVPLLELPAAPGLGELVGRMMAADPEARPRDGGAVLAELLEVAEPPKLAPAPGPARGGVRRGRAWLVAAALLAVLAGAVALRRLLLQPAPGSGPRPLVAVADFANATQDPDLDGISGLLITSLEQSRKLRVLTRSRMLDLLRQTGRSDAGRIDEQLARGVARMARVGALLVPSIRSAGATYVVELRGVDPEREEVLFTLHDRAEGKEAVLPLIDRISERARLALLESDAEIRVTGVKVAESVTPSLEAYRHYFRGKELAARLDDEAARAEFRRALAVEPRFALAQLELALLAAFWGGEDEERLIHAAAANADGFPDKERVSIRAVDAYLSGRLAEAARIAAGAAERYPDDRDVALLAATTADDGAAAIEHLRRALELAPDWDQARWRYVMILGEAGRGAEAVAGAEVAERARPSAATANVLGWARYASGDPAGALAWFRTALRRGPSSQRIGQGIFGAHVALGDVDAARAEIPRGSLFTAPFTAILRAHAGRLRDGAAALESAARKAAGRDRQDLQRFVAVYLAAAGDLDGARRAAADVRAPGLDLVGWLFLAGPEELDRILETRVRPASDLGRLLQARRAHLLGDLDGALTAIRTLDPRTCGFAAWFHGLFAAERGLDEEAMAAFRRYQGCPQVAGRLVVREWFLARAVTLSARSLERLGRAGEARALLEAQLLRWKDADPDLPLLAEMKEACRRVGCRAR